jgi:hypothetical protein
MLINRLGCPSKVTAGSKQSINLQEQGTIFKIIIINKLDKIETVQLRDTFFGTKFNLRKKM